MKCQNCEKELTQIKGKRAKFFCNSTCRSNYWQKMKVLARNLPREYSEPIRMGVKNKLLEVKKYQQTQNKPQEAIKKEKTDESMPEVDNSLILAEIEKVKSAKKPDGMGIKVWEFDQNKKLKMLNSQLK